MSRNNPIFYSVIIPLEMLLMMIQIISMDKMFTVQSKLANPGNLAVVRECVTHTTFIMSQLSRTRA